MIFTGSRYPTLVFDAFIKLLLRSYTGVFTEYTSIDETSSPKEPMWIRML